MIVLVTSAVILTANTAEAITPQPVEYDAHIVSGQQGDAELGFSNIFASLNSIEDVLDPVDYQRNGFTAPIAVRWPNGPSQTAGYNAINLSTAHSVQNHTISHEIGHIIHMRAVGATAVSACPPNTNNWQTASSPQCSTGEGWADFMVGYVGFTSAAAVPFESVEVWGRLLENDVKNWRNGYPNDNVLHACVADTSGNDPAITRGNVARCFWDLYDKTNTYGTTHDQRWISPFYPYHVGRDDLNVNLHQMVDVWDEFNQPSSSYAGDWLDFASYAANEGWSLTSGATASNLAQAIDQVADNNCL